MNYMEVPVRKKSIRDRIQLLNKGKGHYLDYLRNLAPQALLLSFVFVTGSKLNFCVIDFSNCLQTSLFYVLLLGFLIAAYANITNFLDKGFRGLVTWNRRVKTLIDKKGMKRSKQLFVFYWAIFSRKHVEFIEFTIVTFLYQILLVMVFVVAFNSAALILKKG